MKIKQAPITDLLKYMETLYYEKIAVGEHKHILDIIKNMMMNMNMYMIMIMNMMMMMI